MGSFVHQNDFYFLIGDRFIVTNYVKIFHCLSGQDRNQYGKTKKETKNKTQKKREASSVLYTSKNQESIHSALSIGAPHSALLVTHQTLL